MIRLKCPVRLSRVIGPDTWVEVGSLQGLRPDAEGVEQLGRDGPRDDEPIAVGEQLSFVELAEILDEGWAVGLPAAAGHLTGDPSSDDAPPSTTVCDRVAS